MRYFLLEFAVRAALIAAGTAAVLWILRVRNARARHAAWVGVVASMLALPVWTAWGPKASLRLLPAVAAPAATRPAIAAGSFSLPLGGGLETPQPLSWSWPAAPALYLLGVCSMLARLGIGTIRAHVLIGKAANVEGRLTSSACAAPLTAGWLRPQVILPEGWRAWQPAQLAAVLTHEGEHARRRDPLWQWLALVNRAVFWFHPLAWWLERRISALAEEACDAAVLARGHDAHDYSEYLLEMARSVVRTGARVHVLGMAMPGSFLPARIRQILEGRTPPSLTRVRRVSLAVGCVVVSAVFATAAVDREKPQQTRPAPSTPAAPQRAGRQLVAYFDSMAMPEADLALAISAVQNFVKTQMQPDDLLAVMAFSGGRVEVRQDFIGDRDRLVRALDQLAGSISAGSEAFDAGKQLTGLRTAIDMLGPIAGKKAFVYFNSPQLRGSIGPAQLQPVIDAAVRANVALYPIDARGLFVGGDASPAGRKR